jgi:hypothetical protein
MMKLFAGIALALFMTATVAYAAELDVKINARTASVTVQTAKGPVEIMRNQDPDATIDAKYAKTSRKCPPFCIQPMQVAPGVTTVGEIELLEFAKNGGKLIDGRTIEWHLDGTIPSAINMPYTEMASRLDEIGCTGSAGNWGLCKG